MIHLHFIHGFLGFPSDWNIFIDYFKKYHCTFHSITNYMSPSKHDEKSYFNTWADNFNSSIFKEKKSNINILVGYSLGGRLALHSLVSSSNFWDGAIIISANSGLANESEKQARIAIDNLWANRFKNEKWDDVMTLWNSQNVFLNKQNTLSRQESLYNKIEVVRMLTEFSLGKQEDLKAKIKSLNIPILWIAGENDTKFVQIGQEIHELSKNIDLKIIKDAGHRVPWENSNDFKNACIDFINKLIYFLKHPYTPLSQ